MNYIRSKSGVNMAIRLVQGRITASIAANFTRSCPGKCAKVRVLRSSWQVGGAAEGGTQGRAGGRAGSQYTIQCRVQIRD